MSFNSPFTGQVIQPTDVSYRSITLSADTTLSWPINGNVDGDYAARIMNVTATAGSLSLLMPPANQASVGQDALISNIGSNIFTVKDYSGGTIVSISPGDSRYIFIETNANEAGTWGVVEFGASGSGAVASILAGYGLEADGFTLNTAHSVSTLSSDYTVVASDRAKSLLYTGGAGTFTLTSSVTLGNNWFVLVRNGGTGTLTVAPSGGQTINDAAALYLQPADSAIICCSGAEFFTIGVGKNTLFNFSQNTKTVISGTYTLSASEAANAIQKFTGTLTNNVTVELPPTIAVYYITNQTDGGISGYQITFTTGVTGSATATVPAGEQVILLCDSVNLYNASTIAAGGVAFQLIDGSPGGPSLSFASETNTGIYRPGSGQWGISILGSQVVDVDSTGATVYGTGTFINGVSGGTF